MELKLTNNPGLNGRIRHGLIGAGLGLLIVLTLTSLNPGDQGAQQSIVFDDETVAIPAPSDDAQTAKPEEIKGKPEESAAVSNDPQEEKIDRPNADGYPFFSLHRAALSDEELKAIQSGSPVVSVILTDIGSKRTMIDKIIKTLPVGITLSLSPYMAQHNDTAKLLGNHGFELWMDIAAVKMEMNHDHGSLALSPTYNFERNIELLAEQLKNKDKIAGVILPAQSLLNETPRLWENIVTDLYAQGYGVVDNTAKIIKPSLFFHQDKRAPYIKTDLVLDKNMDASAIKEALAEARKDIMDQKSLVVSMPLATPATLDILAEWVNSLKSDGITLVPVSGQAKL